MSGKIPATPSKTNGKPIWRKKITFWTGEHLKHGEIPPGARSFVDDASFGIASATTGTRSALTRRSKDNESAAQSSSMRSSVLPAAGNHARDAKVAMHVLPFVEWKEGCSSIPLGPSDESVGKGAKSRYPCEVSYLRSHTSPIHNSIASLGSRQKPLMSLNNSTVASDGLAAAPYAAATNANEGIPTRKTSVTREALSQKVQLLHEIDMESEPEDPPLGLTGVYLCLPNCRTTDTSAMVETDCSILEHEKEMMLRKTRSNTAACSINHEVDAVNITQEESKLFRQKMREEAIHKELFDDATYDQITLGTTTDYENDEFSEYHATDRLLEKIGLFFNCFPKLPLFSIPSTRDGYLDDDGTYGEGDASYTIGTYDDQTLSTYGNGDDGQETDHEFYDDGEDSYTRSSVSCNLSLLRDKGNTVDESSSYAGSFMDQSHIYLMMTRARHERTLDQTSTIPKNGKDFLASNDDFKKYEVIPALDNRVFISYEEVPPPLTIKAKKHQILKLKDSPGRINLRPKAREDNASFGLIRNIQRHVDPTGIRQFDNMDVHERWMRAIHQALEMDGEWSSSLPTLQQRRAAAQKALTRMLHKATAEKRDRSSTVDLVKSKASNGQSCRA